MILFVLSNNTVSSNVGRGSVNWPGGPKFRKGAGCVKCRNTGYLGRTAVFEIFSATPEVKQLIARRAGPEELLSVARGLGLRTLREAAVRKLAEGETTFEEVLRMTTGI